MPETLRWSQILQLRLAFNLPPTFMLTQCNLSFWASDNNFFWPYMAKMLNVSRTFLKLCVYQKYEECYGTFLERGEGELRQQLMSYAEEFNVVLMHQGDQKVEQYTNATRVTWAIVTPQVWRCLPQHPSISSSTCVTHSNSTSMKG